MPLDPIYTVELNYNIIGLITAGTLIGTFGLLSVLYFHFIDRDKLIQYLLIYFTFVLGSLIITCFEEIQQLGALHTVSTPLLQSIKLLLDYCIVYCFFSLHLYLTQHKDTALSWVLVVAIPLFDMFGYYNDFEVPIYFFYVTITLGLSLYGIAKEMVINRLKYSIPLFILYVIVYLYYVFSQSDMLPNVDLNVLDWIFAIAVVLFSTGFFLYRYKKLLIEKDQLYEKLIHDRLTGLYSKNFIVEMIKHAESGNILFIDINQFKQINDNYGHLIGDEVLRGFSSHISDNVFEWELITSRFGGDEFVVFISDASLEEIQLYTTRLIGTFRDLLKELNIDYMKYSIGLSIGLSKFSHFKGEDALISADFAMYESKNIGNNHLSMRLEEVL